MAERNPSRVEVEASDGSTSLRSSPQLETSRARELGAWRSDRWALVAFVVYLVISFFVLIVAIGDRHWFLGDEWDLLADRTAGNVNDLFRPHNEHWVTIPVLVYRSLWNIFGLKSYVPYQMVGVAVHLSVVVLVRVVMRRSGVNAWVATCAAATLVLFGPGGQNILWGFQIAFTGALAFGLVHLILADHDGPIDRRDWIGLAAGLAALMCSNVGVAMAVTVGLAVLFRRGWRIAAFHTGPLAMAFAVWWLTFRPEVTTAQVGRPTPAQLLRFVYKGEIESIFSIGHFQLVGWALVAVLITGVILVVRSGKLVGLGRRYSAPIALLLGGLVFFATAGVVRAVLGDEEALGHRFVYIGTATALPVIAVAADAIVQRWRALMPLVLIVFLVGIPSNVGAFDGLDPPPELYADRRQWTLLLPTLPLAREVPRSARPDPGGFGSPGLTVGWLLDAQSRGKLPEPPEVPLLVAAETRLRLGVIQLDEPVPDAACVEHSQPLEITPSRGDSIGIKSPVSVSRLNDEGQAFLEPLRFIPRDGERLSIFDDGLRLRFGPVFPNRTYTVCL